MRRIDEQYNLFINCQAEPLSNKVKEALAKAQTSSREIEDKEQRLKRSLAGAQRDAQIINNYNNQNEDTLEKIDK